MTTRAGHGTINQFFIRSIDNKDVKYSGANDTTMQLNSIRIFRHGTSSNIQEKKSLGSDNQYLPTVFPYY
jgi:hypothetical protein